MQITHGHTARRPHGVCNRLSRFAQLKIVLGGILFLGLLFHAVPASSATLPAGASVTLAWNTSTDPNIAGYNLYYGGASRTYTNEVNAGLASSATVSGLTIGATYYFAVTAYDSFGQESGYSSEVTYLVPEPQPTLQTSRATAGQFMLMVTGQASHTYNIEATQDLKVWTVIGTVTIGAGGGSSFTDTNAANFPQRFYRTHG